MTPEPEPGDDLGGDLSRWQAVRLAAGFYLLIMSPLLFPLAAAWCYLGARMALHGMGWVK